MKCCILLPDTSYKEVGRRSGWRLHKVEDLDIGDLGPALKIVKDRGPG